MLIALGFDSKWVAILMLCVESVKYNIQVNGALIGPIIPTRGLRQRDPSPHIYFCTRTFIYFIRNWPAGQRSNAICPSIKKNCANSTLEKRKENVAGTRQVQPDVDNFPTYTCVCPKY